MDPVAVCLAGSMRVLDADDIRERLEPGALVRALRDAFADEGRVQAPERMHLQMDEDLGSTLLVMPAWERSRYVGVKVVGHYPHNGARGLPSILGSYLLSDASTGQPVAVLDATEAVTGPLNPKLRVSVERGTRTGGAAFPQATGCC